MTHFSGLVRPTFVARLLLLLLLGCASSGCATMWTILEVTHSDWDQGRFTDHVEPLGPVEERVTVTGKYVAPVTAPPQSVPDPQVPVEQAPGPVVLQPYPYPPPVQGRPLPRGGVALHCSVERRATLERRYETLHRYDAVWRVITGFLALSEGSLATLLTYFSVNDGPVNVGTLIPGLYLAADTIGTLVLLFHPKQELHRETEGPGQWQRGSDACPENMAVQVETGAFPVEANGSVPELEPWMLQHLVETTFADLHLSVGPQHKAYAPTLDERCAWSDLAQSPAPFCRGQRVSSQVVQGSATFDVPAR